MTGWPGATNQYNPGSANNRVPYPSQQPPPQSPQQPQPPPSQPPTVSANTVSPVVGSINNNTPQWASQQPARPSSQPSINAMPHAPPPWDNRYSHPPSSLYPSPGSHQVRATLLVRVIFYFFIISHLYCYYKI